MGGKIKKCSIASFPGRIKNCDDCDFYKQSRIDYNVSKPIFSFIHLQQEFTLDDTQTEEKIALLNNLILRSQLTWNQIQQAPRKGLGQEIIAQNAIKPSIPSVVKKDTNILALRYNGNKPIVGFRDKDIFHILWIDSKFSVYNH